MKAKSSSSHSKDAVISSRQTRAAKRSVDHLSEDFEFQIKSFYSAKKACTRPLSEPESVVKPLKPADVQSLNKTTRTVRARGRSAENKIMSSTKARSLSRSKKEVKNRDPIQTKENVDSCIKGRKFFKHRTTPGQRSSFQMNYHKQNSRSTKRRNTVSPPAKVKPKKTVRNSRTKRHSYAALEFYSSKPTSEKIADDSEPPVLVRENTANADSACIDIPPVLRREIAENASSESAPNVESEARPSPVFGSSSVKNIVSRVKNDKTGKSSCNNKYSQDLFSGEFGSSCSSPAREKTQSSEPSTPKDDIDGLVEAISTTPVLSDNKNILNCENQISPAIINGKKCYPIFHPNSSPMQTTLKINKDKSPGSRNSTPRRQTLLKTLRENGKEQMILDFGQKEHVAIQCPTCGMIYTEKEPEDEAAHTRFHQRLLNTLKYKGSKKERVIQEFSDGKIVLLSFTEKSSQKKIASILKVVDEDLGFSEHGSDRSQKLNKRIYIYVSDEKKIVGCCVAEPITHACRVLADGENQKEGKAWCCSTERHPCRSGISRIWVFKNARRRGIATRLLDCLRYNFVLGYPLSMSDIAFTDPTADGKQFATSYTGSKEFLVYK